MRYSLLCGVRDGRTVVGGGQVRLRHRCARGDGDWWLSIGRGGDGHFCPPPAKSLGLRCKEGRSPVQKLHTRTVTIMKHVHVLGVSTVEGTLNFYSGGRNEGGVRCVILHPAGTMKTMGIFSSI